jgi:hypothetical protein
MHDDSLKFLGPKHGHEQVNEQQYGNNTRDNGFHRCLLEFFAKPGVEAADNEEAGNDANENQITHKTFPSIHTTFFPPALWIRTDAVSRPHIPRPAAASSLNHIQCFDDLYSRPHPAPIPASRVIKRRAGSVNKLSTPLGLLGAAILPAGTGREDTRFIGARASEWKGC